MKSTVPLVGRGKKVKETRIPLTNSSFGRLEIRMPQSNVNTQSILLQVKCTSDWLAIINQLHTTELKSKILKVIEKI